MEEDENEIHFSFKSHQSQADLVIVFLEGKTRTFLKFFTSDEMNTIRFMGKL